MDSDEVRILLLQDSRNSDLVESYPLPIELSMTGM